MRSSNLSTELGMFLLGYLVLCVALVATIMVGWVINLGELLSQNADMSQIEVAFRAVGVVVAPLGAFMGYAF